MFEAYSKGLKLLETKYQAIQCRYKLLLASVITTYMVSVDTE
jgi:hypothetical protein